MTGMQQVQRTYYKEFGAAMAGYVVLLFGTAFIADRGVGQEWRTVLAVLPAVPILFVIRAFVHFLRGTDELQRRIQLESLAIAFGGGAFLAVASGLLESAGIVHLNPFWLYGAMMMLWLLALTVTSRRYR